MNALTEATCWVQSHTKRALWHAEAMAWLIQRNTQDCANNTTRIKSNETWTMSMLTWNSIQLMIEREMRAEILRNITRIKPIMVNTKIRDGIMPTMDLVRMWIERITTEFPIMKSIHLWSAISNRKCPDSNSSSNNNNTPLMERHHFLNSRNLINNNPIISRINRLLHFSQWHPFSRPINCSSNNTLKRGPSTDRIPFRHIDGTSSSKITCKGCRKGRHRQRRKF